MIAISIECAKVQKGGDDVHEEPAEGLKIVGVGSISPFASELLRTSAI